MSTDTLTRTADAVTVAAPKVSLDASFEDRFKAAVKAVRKSGVVIKQNLSSCCNSCLDYSDFGLADGDNTSAYAYTFGGQDQAYSWRDGLPIYRSAAARLNKRPWVLTRAEHRPEMLYFGHGGSDMLAARTLVAVFAAHGVETKWEGERHYKVGVVVPAQS